MGDVTEEVNKLRNSKFRWQDEFANSRITPYSAGFIGMVMSNRDNGDGKGFYISAKTLHEKTGISTRTVERSIALLLASGWISRDRKGGRWGDVSVASRYSLTVPDAHPLSHEGEEGAPNPSRATPHPVTGVAQPVTDGGVVDQRTTPLVRPEESGSAGMSSEEGLDLSDVPSFFEDEEGEAIVELPVKVYSGKELAYARNAFEREMRDESPRSQDAPVRSGPRSRKGF